MSAIDLVTQHNSAVIAELNKLIESNPLAVLEALQSAKGRKSVLVDLEKAAFAPLVEFSNQESFDVMGEKLSLHMIARLAYSKLVVKEGEYTDKFGQKQTRWTSKEVAPKSYAFNEALWEVLRKVQKGKEAQGHKFDLSVNGLRDFVEAGF
jgi:hypothetical protein